MLPLRSIVVFEKTSALSAWRATMFFLTYLRAADFLNISNVDIVCLQHEFGIFGGPAGGHILAFLRELRMPVVTTLHTVLREPRPEQRRLRFDYQQVLDALPQIPYNRHIGER